MSQISTNKVYPALGPYSEAIGVKEYIYTSGIIGLDPDTGKVVSGGIEAETNQILKNLDYILKAGDSGIPQVIKTTVYLTDIKDFDTFNKIYGQWFETHPAREVVEVSALPFGACVEISAVAITAREHIF